MTPDQTRAARDALGLTQAQLASVLGLGPRIVRAWESGERNPSPTAALAVALMLYVNGVLRNEGFYARYDFVMPDWAWRLIDHADGVIGQG